MKCGRKQYNRPWRRYSLLVLRVPMGLRGRPVNPNLGLAPKVTKASLKADGGEMVMGSHYILYMQ